MLVNKNVKKASNLIGDCKMIDKWLERVAFCFDNLQDKNVCGKPCKIRRFGEFF